MVNTFFKCYYWIVCNFCYSAIHIGNSVTVSFSKTFPPSSPCHHGIVWLFGCLLQSSLRERLMKAKQVCHSYTTLSSPIFKLVLLTGSVHRLRFANEDGSVGSVDSVLISLPCHQPCRMEKQKDCTWRNAVSHLFAPLLPTSCWEIPGLYYCCPMAWCCFFAPHPHHDISLLCAIGLN